MRPFRRHTGTAVPLDRMNVDTDQIIPKEFCVRVERTGFGQYLFHHWRQQPGFVLDLPQFRGASILLAGDNFGCGSSREHAVWAIEDAGYRVVVAPSFGDIFRNNCSKNGVLPIAVDMVETRKLISLVSAEPATLFDVDLEARIVAVPGWRQRFEIDDFVRKCLLNGWDDIGLTMRHEVDIAAFEAGLPAWVVPVGRS